MRAPHIPPYEIWWVVLPPEQGHVQSGARPAVILADHPESRFSIVLPLTTRLERMKFSHTLLLEPTRENGLRQQSVVLGFQIRYVDRELVTGKLGKLAAEDRDALRAIISDLLGL